MEQSIQTNTERKYKLSLERSLKSEWKVEDLLRDRQFDFKLPFLPEGLVRSELHFGPLSFADRKLLSQIQGRTYAYIFGLVERFINAKITELALGRSLESQVELESLARFSLDELKHQRLFRVIEEMIGAKMPEGYRQAANPNDVAKVVLKKSSWAVLALTCHIEVFVMDHYKESISAAEKIDPLFKDIFRYHWIDEAQHTVIDELEWLRENATLSNADRDQAVNELIELVVAVDSLLQAQSRSDSEYFAKLTSRVPDDDLYRSFLKSYRWQYILSGAGLEKFQNLLFSMINDEQKGRILKALSTLQ